jgi:hypothetical protein
MASSDTARYYALERAVAKHGVAPVIARLEYVKINATYLKQTEKDIGYIKSIDADNEDFACEAVDERRRSAFGEKKDRLHECMRVLNEKLCKATLDKGVAMINLLFTRMSTL